MLNVDVTRDNIATTIYVRGFTKTVRPATSYTNGVKLKLMREAGIPESDAKLFELDHIVSLELGGHPRKLANLQLEPWDGEWGAHSKDKLENKLHRLVCSGKIDLATAQREIGSDWVSAYRKYLRQK